ncbi:MAG: hypothetical protein P0S96_04195 [Simkaniaceae bacterium]|nr:hypothetical protein [Candidatus Sacchlamyda saccharinae]
MLNNIMTCPAPGFNTTNYPPETQDGTSFGTADILAGTAVALGAALFGAARYQMNKVMQYLDGNRIRFAPYNMPSQLGFLLIARKLAKLDPGRPSLLDPTIDQRHQVLQDLIVAGDVENIGKFLRLTDDLETPEALIRFVQEQFAGNPQINEYTAFVNANAMI